MATGHNTDGRKTEEQRDLDQTMWWWEIRRAEHTMQFPWRATFLILFLAPLLHVDWIWAVVASLGYWFCTFLEHLAKQRVLDEVLDGELEWKTDSEDPEREENANEDTRRKLPWEHQ